MNRWLSRLAFSFLIVAGLLAVQGYREVYGAGPVVKWRIGLYAVAIGVLVGLAVKGINTRHKAGDL